MSVIMSERKYRSSMPKKRFTTQFSKPQSTVHPSLSSAGSASSSRNDAPPTVNDLISSSRKNTATTGTPVASPTPTLPPQIRHLLSQPETPAPTPRTARLRRRLDANGRPLPAGPPAPRSWLERSRHAPESMRTRGEERAYPTDLYHLPGLKETSGRSLQDMCMRQMARHWEYLREYEQNNLAELPTRVRMELLSFIAVDGPDDGVGFDGLRRIVLRPDLATETTIEDETPMENNSKTTSPTPKINKEKEKEQFDSESPLEDWDEQSSDSSYSSHNHNEGFFRLDLSGSIGNSISCKQLIALLEKPSPSLSAPIPHLTHLSLSHPSQSAPWRGLLAFSQHIPTLTHLSLAYWPAPTLTPNSRTAVMTSQYGKDVQYGGTNFYSLSLDNDFREAAQILRRLASRLYGLEYLDLSGCSEWFKAIHWTGLEDRETNLFDVDRFSPALDMDGNVPKETTEGIDWSTQFLRLTTLKLSSDIILAEESTAFSVSAFVKSVKEARATERVLKWWMTKGGRSSNGKWVDVKYEDWLVYKDLWMGQMGMEEKRKRSFLNTLREKGLWHEGLQLKFLEALERAGERRGVDDET